MVLGLLPAAASTAWAAPPRAGLPIVVDAAGNCPDAERVNLELRRMGVPTSAAPADGDVAGPARPDRALVVEEPEHVRVRLQRADGGEVIGDRSIAAGSDCGERAAAVAVLIGAWNAELPSELPGDLVVKRAGPRQQSTPPRWWPSLGAAGLGVASAADAWTLGLALDGALVHGSGWGPRVTAWGTGFRAQALGEGPGRARWTRWAVGLGPSYQTARTGGTSFASVFGQVAVGQLRVEGDGFPVSHRSSTLDWGLRAGVEGGLRRGSLSPVMGLGVAFWPRSQRAIAIGGDEATDLPSLDVLLTVGLRWENPR